MKVKDIEVRGLPADTIEHQHVIGDRILDMRVETQCGSRAANQVARRNGIAAREERDVVPRVTSSSVR